MVTSKESVLSFRHVGCGDIRLVWDIRLVGKCLYLLSCLPSLTKLQNVLSHTKLEALKSRIKKTGQERHPHD